jgi:hypothetical protein
VVSGPVGGRCPPGKRSRKARKRFTRKSVPPSLCSRRGHAPWKRPLRGCHADLRERWQLAPQPRPCSPNSRTSCALGVQSAVSGFGRGPLAAGPATASYAFLAQGAKTTCFEARSGRDTHRKMRSYVALSRLGSGSAMAAQPASERQRPAMQGTCRAPATARRPPRT